MYNLKPSQTYRFIFLLYTRVIIFLYPQVLQTTQGSVIALALNCHMNLINKGKTNRIFIISSAIHFFLNIPTDIKHKDL